MSRHRARFTARGRWSVARRVIEDGAIVNVSSVAATFAFPGISGYSATKSAGELLAHRGRYEAG